MAHFWFVTIHPFDDGNGRVARAIADLAIAQDEGSELRLYSVSAQISTEREQYYEVLERCQRGSGDISGWLVWMLGCLARAIERAEKQIGTAVVVAKFWQRASRLTLSARQKKVLNRLLDAGPGGFEGGLTTRKYIGMTKTSRATAKREIADLVEKKLLVRGSAGGRSTNYELAWDAILDGE
jgi:Fic family protein